MKIISGGEYFEYRPEIDGLRGVAVLVVILFHAGIKGFDGGFVGVDVFFVISGYLITRNILQAHVKRNFSYLDFYERRARRILPALYFVLLVCIPFAYLWLFPDDLQNFGQSLFAVATFMSNILFWRESGYFEAASELKPLLHTWSLTVEEQFYVLFPIIFVTLVARKLPIKFILVIACLVSFVAAVILSYYFPAIAFYWLPTRIWQLLVGVLIAWVTFPSGQHRDRKYDQLFSLSGLGLIIFAIFGSGEGAESQMAGWQGQTMATFGAGLVIYHWNTGTLAFKLLSIRPLVFIGLMSYSVYLWNQPIIAFYKQVTPEPLELLQMVIISLATILIGYLSYRYVETPFRNKHTISKKCFAGLVIALTGVFIISGLVTHRYKGFPDRVAFETSIAHELGSVIFFDHLSDKYQPCWSKEILSQALVYPKNKFVRCMQSKKGKTVDVVIVGDSHAEHLFPGIADALPEENVAFYIKGGMPVRSNPSFSVIYSEIGNDANIKVVFLSAAWSAQTKHYGLEEFEDELEASVSYFLARGQKVVLLDDVPYFPFDPKLCIAKLPYSLNQRFSCKMPLSHVEAYESTYVPILRRVANTHEDMVYVGLKDLFCEEKTCSMMIEDRLLYRDNDHLSLQGSHFVARRITNSIPN